MSTKNNNIGFIVTIPKFIKKEYLSKKKKHGTFTIIEIEKNKKFGAIAKIYERNSLFDRLHEKTTKKERKKISDSLKNIEKNKKPLDTSKWVKPDEESIRNALIESLFALELFQEDSFHYHEYYGRAKVLYALLHDHSPKNPQRLGNWSIDPFFKSIMSELNSPVIKKWYDKFNKDFKKKNKSKEHWKNRRKEYQIWKKDCLNNMIIPDPKPHRYKNIFKETIKLIESEKNKQNKNGNN